MGPSFSLFLLLKPASELFNLLHVESRCVLLSHARKLGRLTVTLFLPSPLLFSELRLLGEHGLDVGILGALRPGSNSVSLGLNSRDVELHEGQKPWKNPLVNELVKNDAKLASRRVNFLTEATSELEKDFLELKEADFDSAGVDDVPADDVLVPLLLELSRLGLLQRATSVFVKIRLLSLREWRSFLGGIWVGGHKSLHLSVILLFPLSDRSVSLLSRIVVTVELD